MFWSAGFILVLGISQVPALPTANVAVKAVYPINALTELEASLSGAGGSRIVSGWNAEPGQIPFQTSLRMVSSVGAVTGCGGSVVHREWVISAAHCTASQITVVVRAGLTTLLRPEYIFETLQWWDHPSYNVNDPLRVQPNDISIVKLSSPVTYSPNLQPIRIQSRADAFRNYDTVVLIASGFGRTWTMGQTTEDLQWVYLSGVSNLYCGQLFGTALINHNAICAGFYNVTSQSTCQGDSGGPLVHVDSEGVPTLVGIASFVAGDPFGCHSGIPAGFCRPGPFQNWLQEVTGIDFENFDEEGATTTTTTSTTTTSTTTTTTTTTEAPEPEPEDSDDDSSSSSSEELDPEVEELLKKLIVKVKVKVKVNDKVKKKIKVKCEDHI